MDAKIKYFLCEDTIVVRVIEETDNYKDTLEYYNPRVEGWIPNKTWYNDMFVNKVVNFKEITKEDSNKYIQSSIDYFKKNSISPIYVRRIYGLDLEYLNPKTGEWNEVLNNDWYDTIDEFDSVSKEEVENYIDNIFSKKMIK